MWLFTGLNSLSKCNYFCLVSYRSRAYLSSRCLFTKSWSYQRTVDRKPSLLNRRKQDGRQVKFCTELSSPDARKRANISLEKDGIRQEDYALVYKMSRMPLLRVISRLKILQVTFMAAFTGPMAYAYSEGSVALGTMSWAVGGCVGTTAVLFILSYFFRKVIGELRFCKVDESVVISHLTFWGNRRNDKLDLEDIMPWSDGRDLNPNKLFHSLQLYDTRKHYYYSIKYGQVLDKEAFEDVFGFPLTSDSKPDKVEDTENITAKSSRENDETPFDFGFPMTPDSKPDKVEDIEKIMAKGARKNDETPVEYDSKN